MQRKWRMRFSAILSLRPLLCSQGEEGGRTIKRKHDAAALGFRGEKRKGQFC